MKKFAIILVCFNRIEGLKRLIKSLECVDYNNRTDITLIFSIDNSGASDVEDFAKNYKWNYGRKIIRTFKERQGLKKHILQCGDYTEDYDIVTVLEDDIVISNSFYNYAYTAAEFYWDDDNIAGISLYNFEKNWLKWIYRFEPMKNDYDVYFLKVAQSWGQVWTKKKWSLFKEWYRDNSTFLKSDDIPEYLNEWPESSWLKYHDRYCIEKNKFFVYPYYSLSTNCSDAGVHATHSVNDYQVELQMDKKKYNFPFFNKESIIYDEYMNRVFLGKYLKIDDKELTIDFYGNKREKDRKRYLLTTKNLSYKIIKEFSLSLRPIELSIILNFEGKGIFLYDTFEIGTHKLQKNNIFNLMNYFFRTHDWKEILGYSLKISYIEVKGKILRKMRKLWR